MYVGERPAAAGGTLESEAISCGVARQAALRWRARASAALPRATDAAVPARRPRAAAAGAGSHKRSARPGQRKSTTARRRRGEQHASMGSRAPLAHQNQKDEEDRL